MATSRLGAALGFSFVFVVAELPTQRKVNMPARSESDYSSCSAATDSLALVSIRSDVSAEWRPRKRAAEVAPPAFSLR